MRIGRLIVMAMVLCAPWVAVPFSDGSWKFTSLSQSAQCFMLLAGIIGLSLWWICGVINGKKSTGLPFLAIPVVIGLILVGIQLLPLPDGIAGVLAPQQHELFAKYASPVTNELLSDSEAKPASTFISMSVDSTSRMFNLLMLVFVVMLLASFFFSSRKTILHLPIVLTLNGVAISIYGIVQTLSGNKSIYGIETIGAPFGPFVNKNNAAGYLLLCLASCLLLAFVVFNSRPTSGSRPRKIITKDYPIWKRAWLHLGLFIAELTATRIAVLMVSIVVFSGIVFTFSRGGILALGIGIFASCFYYAVTQKSPGIIVVVPTILFFMLGVFAFFGVSDQLFDRLGSLSDVDLLNQEGRVAHWVQTSPAIWDFSPLGSGLGSYLDVHRLYRIDSENKVFYFAENQYFNTLVELGIPGIIMMVLAILILIGCFRFIANHGKSPKTGAICFFGSFLVPSQIAAAFFDFGHFIPANAIALACLCGLVAGQAHTLAGRISQKTWFKKSLPRPLATIALLAIFSATVYSLLSCYRYSEIENNMAVNPYTVNFETFKLPETELAIEQLEEKLRAQPDANGLIRLAELYIYRYRLELFDEIVGPDAVVKGKSTEAMELNWQATSADRLHSLIHNAWQKGDAERVKQLASDPQAERSLLPAAFFLKQARKRAPLNPAPHLLLAQLQALSPDRNSDSYHLSRSSELSPANANTAFICGVLSLQANRIESACKNLNKCLKIDRTRYARVIAVSNVFLPPQRIVQDVLPDDPKLLYNFASNHMTSKSLQPAKFDLHKKIISLLDEGQQWDRRSLVIKAELQEGTGDLQGAIDTIQLSVDLNPDHQDLRLRHAKLLVEAGQYDKAVKVMRHLARQNDRFVRYYLQVKAERDRRLKSQSEQ